MLSYCLLSTVYCLLIHHSSFRIHHSSFLMTNEYDGKALLSYNRYLRVRELIDLQTCLSDPAHHDELLFITVHQAYELWFKQILHEIDAGLVRSEEHTSELQ